MTIAAIHRRTLQKAVRIFGGEDALAARLGVTREELGAWIAEEKALPLPMFVAVVDLVSRAARGDAVWTEAIR